MRSCSEPYDKWDEGTSAMSDDMLTMLATRWFMRSGRNVLIRLN